MKTTYLNIKNGQEHTVFYSKHFLSFRYVIRSAVRHCSLAKN